MNHIHTDKRKGLPDHRHIKDERRLPKPGKKRFKILFSLMKELEELHKMSMSGGIFKN